MLLKEVYLYWLNFIRFLPGNSGLAIRFLVYRRLFCSCGKKVIIAPGCYIRGGKNIILGDNIGIGLNAQVYAEGSGKEQLKIGNYVFLNSNVMLNADLGGQIQIGNNVLIGPNVVIRASNHSFADPNVPIEQQGHVPGRIVIEDDVWLGANVVVLPNVTIGRGAVVAAGAVVTKDVAPFSVVGGVPARLISKRGAA
jgi:galactoside O-acetyltransferase